jgi:rubredoxin
MANYRYILQSYKPNLRYECPDCGKKKSFARYIDTETDEQLNEKVGRCNRESGCGYHYSPKEYFTDNNIPQDENTFKTSKARVVQPINFIDDNVFKKSLTGYGSNHLVTFLKSLFNEKTVQDLAKKYQLGTSSHWPGATTFWYVDTIDRVNYGKIMVYDPKTGKRDKVKIEHCASVLEKTYANSGTSAPEWLIKYQENESKINCLFGEHLLKNDHNKPVAIVESEKTALKFY